jgi:uncharacterized protein YecT (DUF1311 family)
MARPAPSRDAEIPAAAPEEVEDPFRPPTTPRSPPPRSSAGERAGDTNADPKGSVPSPRCLIGATADQRACLLAYVAVGDAPLDRVFGSLVTELRRVAGAQPGDPDPVTVQRVRVEQRAWIAIRNEECRSQPSAKEGPFWAPAHAQCFNQMSAARVAELQDAVKRLRKKK